MNGTISYSTGNVGIINEFPHPLTSHIQITHHNQLLQLHKSLSIALHSRCYWPPAWISPTHAYIPNASRFIVLRLIFNHVTFLLNTVRWAPVALMIKPNHLMWFSWSGFCYIFQFFEYAMPHTVPFSNSLQLCLTYLTSNLPLDFSLKVTSWGLEDILQRS